MILSQSVMILNQKCRDFESHSIAMMRTDRTLSLAMRDRCGAPLSQMTTDSNDAPQEICFKIRTIGVRTYGTPCMSSHDLQSQDTNLL